MRIRSIKPAFWSDSRMAELPEATRLFYVGLWMIADDAGWLRWDVPEIARELYSYEARKKREARVSAMFDRLLADDRVILYDCGHVEIPTFGAHQRMAAATRQVKTSQKEHEGCISPRPVPFSGKQRRSAESSGQAPLERIGTERYRNGIGTGAGGRARPEAPADISDFQRRLPRSEVLG